VITYFGDGGSRACRKRRTLRLGMFRSWRELERVRRGSERGRGRDDPKDGLVAGHSQFRGRAVISSVVCPGSPWCPGGGVCGNKTIYGWPISGCAILVADWLRRDGFADHSQFAGGLKKVFGCGGVATEGRTRRVLAGGLWPAPIRFLRVL